MYLSNFIIYLTFVPLFGINNSRFKRQLDVSYGSPSYFYCECGRKNEVLPIDIRIVGGKEVQENEYPWMAVIVALVGAMPELICGASLINDRYVITAAHCLTSKYTRDQVKIILGEHNLCTSNVHTVTLSVEKFVQHPKYIATKHLVADIMLVKLNMRVTFDAYIRPICLPRRSRDRIAAQIGLIGEILGWGLGRGSKDLCMLRKSSVSIFRDCRVRSFYSFCAGDPNGDRDACAGDSGGPFQIANTDGNFEIIGIISAGLECGDAESPGIYSDVTYVLSWIHEVTRDSMYCWK